MQQPGVRDQHQTSGIIGDRDAGCLPQHRDAAGKRRPITCVVARQPAGANVFGDTVQNQVNCLDRAAGLFCEHHSEPRHFLFTVGKRADPTAVELMRDKNRNARKQQCGKNLNLPGEASGHTPPRQRGKSETEGNLPSTAGRCDGAATVLSSEAAARARVAVVFSW